MLDYRREMPKKYRGGNASSPQLFIMLGLLFLILPIFLIFTMKHNDIRKLYSELVVHSFSLSENDTSITLYCNYSKRYEKTKTPFDYEVLEIKKNNKTVNIKNTDDVFWSEDTLIDTIVVPIEESDKSISIKQRNGLQQLILEKDTETLKWKEATNIAKIKFFYQNYTVYFVILAIILIIILIAIIISLIKAVNIYKKSSRFK